MKPLHSLKKLPTCTPWPPLTDIPFVDRFVFTGINMTYNIDYFGPSTNTLRYGNTVLETTLEFTSNMTPEFYRQWSEL